MSDKIAREQLIDHFDSSRCWRSGCVSCDAIREALTESDIAHWMDRCHELEEMLTEKPKVNDDIPPGYFQLNIPIWVLVKMDFFKRLKKMGYEVDMKKTNQYIANSMVDNSEVRRRTSDKEGL